MRPKEASFQGIEPVGRALAAGRQDLDRGAKGRMRQNGIHDPVLTFRHPERRVDTPHGRVLLAVDLRLRASGRVAV